MSLTHSLADKLKAAVKEPTQPKPQQPSKSPPQSMNKEDMLRRIAYLRAQIAEKQSIDVEEIESPPTQVEQVSECLSCSDPIQPTTYFCGPCSARMRKVE